LWIAGLVWSAILGTNSRQLFAAEDSKNPMRSFMEQRGYLCIPLKHTDLNRFQLRGKLDGAAGVVVVDTGAPKTAVDRQKASNLERLRKQRTSGRGLFGYAPSEVEFVTIDSVQLEGISISNVTAQVSDLRHREVHTGSRIPRPEPELGEDLVLGMDLLAALHGVMDCGAAVLYVRAALPGPELARSIDQSFCQSGYVCIGLTGYGGWLLVDTVVNEKKAVFVLDSGAAVTQMDLNQLQAFQLANRGAIGRVSDINAHHAELSYVMVNSFKIGAYERRKFPVGVIDMHLPNAFFEKSNQPPVLGMIGPDLLTRAGALIDCAGRKLYLRPEK